MVNIDDLIADAIGKNDEQQAVLYWLDTGYPPLNKAISGEGDKGLPSGRIIEIYGPPSSGKTAIATAAMASAQRLGGIAVFMDHENSFDVVLAEQLGLDTSTKWVYKQPETFEQSVDMVVRLGKMVREKKVIPESAPIIAVFDSLASMVPQSKMFDAKGNERDSESYTMHDNTALARATSSAFPALAQMARKYNMCLVFLNQQRQKPGVAYGDPNTTPGGNAPEYYSSVRIGLTREIIKDKDKEVIGQVINATCKKNKVSRPFKKASWNFMFRPDGRGYFDIVGSLIEVLKDNGGLKKEGHRLVWPLDGKSYFPNALKEHIEQNGLSGELIKIWETSTGEKNSDE